MNSHKLSQFFILILCFTYFSCSDEKEELPTDLDSNISNSDHNFVAINQIENISESIFSDSSINFKKKYAGKEAKKSILEIKPIGSDENKPSFYIVNYKGGWFFDFICG